MYVRQIDFECHLVLWPCTHGLGSHDQGTGIGLCVCQNIAQQMGGKVGVFPMTKPCDFSLSEQSECGCDACVHEGWRRWSDLSIYRHHHQMLSMPIASTNAQKSTRATIRAARTGLGASSWWWYDCKRRLPLQSRRRSCPRRRSRLDYEADGEC